MVLIPKSIKFHDNLTESEIRAYYSIRPRDEDYADHDKRFSNILNDYLNSMDFKSNNAKLCYKKQLKKMAKDIPTNSKKWAAFNNWRLARIEFHISRQKDYLLKQQGKPLMPKKREKKEDNSFGIKMNDLLDQNKDLLKQVEELKKQLTDKDNQIDYLLAENSKMKYMPHEIEEEKPKEIYEINECLIESSEEEEEEEEIEVEIIQITEELIKKIEEEPRQIEEVKEEKKIILHFDTEEEEEDSSSEEEDSSSEEEEEEEIKKIPYSHREFYKIRNIFYDICDKKTQPYYEQYMSKGKDMNDKERNKLRTQLNIDYCGEVVEVEIERLDNLYEIPEDIYTDIFYGAEDKLNHKFNYHGFDNED